MSDEAKIYRYAGSEGEVVWDGRLCIHVGECGRATGELFVGGRQPWCQPDAAGGGEEEILAVIARCPSGALTYEKNGTAVDEKPTENTVTVANHGPLYASGELKIDGAGDDMPGTRYRAALCRCGLSKNKPFCDNSHEEGGFSDRGAVGDTGATIESTDGPLAFSRVKNGPLLVNGTFTIISGGGRRAWTGTKAALCRCGHSKNKPFCDGAHKAAGFEAD